MEAVICEYEYFKDISLELPPWVMVSIADAYLYLEQPEKSLMLYREIYNQQWDPQYGSTRMLIYHNLVALGRYKEASAVLDELDEEMPVQIVDRGILKDNWRKEEIAYNRGWSLLYQDRLTEAQEYFEDLFSRGPFNTHSRIGLAHAYLWRGWPRLALEEFKVAHTIDSKDIVGEVGYCYALDRNDRREEARAITKDLLCEHPNNKHVQKLKRYLKVQDMRTFSFSIDSISEDPGVDELDWSVRVDQPVAPWRKIFAGFIYRYASQDDLKDKIRRAQLGLDWRLNRDWWFVGDVSLDKDGRSFGHSEQITFDFNDYLSSILLHNSYSLSVPLRARVTGVEAREWSSVMRYRHSESFLAQAGASLLELSDNNDHWSYNFKLDKALTTQAYWKTRLALEGYAATYSKTDVSYFSPKHLYSIYLIPMIEHVWYRRYERSLLDRFFVGIGPQWQDGFSVKDVWYVRYEQDYKLSDTLSFLIGADFHKRNYDGVDTDVWGFNFAFKTNF